MRCAFKLAAAFFFGPIIGLMLFVGAVFYYWCLTQVVGIFITEPSGGNTVEDGIKAFTWIIILFQVLSVCLVGCACADAALDEEKKTE